MSVERDGVAVVLVNYNGGRDLVECLEALLRSPDEDWRVIVIDNNSTDDSLALIAAWANAAPADFAGHPDVWGRIPKIRRADPTILFFDEDHRSCPAHRDGQIIVICARENRGFAAGNNIGLRFAFRDPRCGYAWLLNADTAPLPGAGLALLSEIRSEDRIGMVGSTLVYYYRPSEIQGLGVHYDVRIASGHQIWRGKNPAELPKKPAVRNRITYVIGASMFISREFYEEVGPMNEKYFLYFEEMDWSERSRGRFKTSWAPDSLVYHKEGGSIGTSTTSWPSQISVYYMSRGIILFYKEHRPALILVAIFRLFYNFARMAASGKLSLCVALWKGAVDGLTSSRRCRVT